MALTKAIVLMKLRAGMLLGPNESGWRDSIGEIEMQYVPLHYI